VMVPPQRCFTGGMAQALHTAYRQALILRTGPHGWARRRQKRSSSWGMASVPDKNASLCQSEADVQQSNTLGFREADRPSDALRIDAQVGVTLLSTMRPTGSQAVWRTYL